MQWPLSAGKSRRMALYGEISKDYRTEPSIFPAKKSQNDNPNLGQSCRMWVQRNENPKSENKNWAKNEKMEKKNIWMMKTFFMGHDLMDSFYEAM